MTFSHYAGFAIVPTLSRIVLCVAFITAGYSKFLDDQFTAAQAAELTALGVRVSPKATSHADSWIIKPARFQVINAPEAQTQPETQPSDEPPVPSEEPPPSTRPVEPPRPQPSESPDKPPSPSTTTPSTSPGETSTGAPPTAPATQPTATQPAAEEMFHATRMHHITLMLHAKQWPRPVLMAWMAAMTELVAGALLAIGLFSRLWGFALACVMGVAFYLTSWPALVAAGFRPLAMDPATFSTTMLQSALFVLAFGVFLTGAGPLSLDRLLFGGRTEVIEVDEVSTVRR